MIKRITTLVFVFLTIVGNAVWGQNVWDGSIATGFAGGTGTETDPYQISNGAELAFLAQEVNNNSTYNASYYILTSDITLNTGSCENWETNAPQNEWTPIGGTGSVSGGTFNVSKSFQGGFDGNGHTIRGIYINNEDETNKSSIGLFGAWATNDKTIKNLKVENSYIKGSTNNVYVGGIVGFNNGDNTISNCSFSGIIEAIYTGKACTFTTGIGGILGTSSSECMVENCHNDADIKASFNNVTDFDQLLSLLGSRYYISGVGAMGNFSHSYNTGEITVNINTVGKQNVLMMICVGGIGNSASEITSCYNTGNINVVRAESSSDDHALVGVGGIQGLIAYGEATYCYNIGGINTTNLNGIQSPSASYTNAVGVGSIVGLAQYEIEHITLSKNYYLESEELSPIGGSIQDESEAGDITEEQASAKTPDAFANGEVAYLLREGGYGQDLTISGNTPFLTNIEEDKVYRLTLKESEEDSEPQIFYANSGNNIKLIEDDEFETIEKGKSLVGMIEGNKAMSLGQLIELDADLELTLVETEDIYHAINITSSEGITITPDRKFAKENEEVSLTVKVENDEIYTFNNLIVAGNTGNNVEVEKNEDGTYQFTMPDTDVNVTASVTTEDKHYSIVTYNTYFATLSASPQCAKEGDIITLTLHIEENSNRLMKVKSFETVGISSEQIQELDKAEDGEERCDDFMYERTYKYQFTMPNNNVSIKAYAAVGSWISIESDGNGYAELITKTAYGTDEVVSYVSSTVENMIYGVATNEEKVTMRIYPNPGYEFDEASLHDWYEEFDNLPDKSKPVVVTGDNDIYTFTMPSVAVYGTLTFKEVTSEEPGDEDDNQGSDIHKPQRPIKYYNIYVDTICPGLNVEVSKDVVQEGHQVSAYLTIQAECDTTGMRFEYKRGLFGYWQDLKALEGVQPGEYIIKNIYTDIYIRALDATLPEEEPTGIEDVEGIKAYAQDGSIYVYTPNREEVMIIGMSGAIIKHAEQVGLQSYSVSHGIYIVRIGEKVFKLKN